MRASGVTQGRRNLNVASPPGRPFSRGEARRGARPVPEPADRSVRPSWPRETAFWRRARGEPASPPPNGSRPNGCMSAQSRMQSSVSAIAPSRPIETTRHPGRSDASGTRAALRTGTSGGFNSLLEVRIASPAARLPDGWCRCHLARDPSLA